MRHVRSAPVEGRAATEIKALVGIADRAGLHEAVAVLQGLLSRSVAGRPSLARDEAAAQRQRVLDRDGYRCRNVWCRSDKNLTVDHIVPRSEQGPDDEGNLWTLCMRCHEFKEHGTFVPVHDQRTGEWRLIDTRRALRCQGCHAAILRGETAVVPTTGGAAREVVARVGSDEPAHCDADGAYAP